MFCYNELLCRGYTVYIGKTNKGEIDYIVNNGDHRTYYQVAYLLYDEQVIKREFGAFDHVDDHHQKYVISMDKHDFSRNGIQHMYLLDFLLNTPDN